MCSCCADNDPEPDSRYGLFHHTSPRKSTIGGKCHAQPIRKLINDLEREQETTHARNE
jgi:hypothetical protein